MRWKSTVRRLMHKTFVFGDKNRKNNGHLVCVEMLGVDTFIQNGQESMDIIGGFEANQI